MTQYDMGRWAFRAGEPYRFSKPQDWQDGYTDAEIDAREQDAETEYSYGRNHD